MTSPVDDPFALLDLCRSKGLSWWKALDVAGFPAVGFIDLSVGERERLVAKIEAWEGRDGGQAVARGGGCIPLEQTADERRWERAFDRRQVVRGALWNVAASLAQRQTSGPSFLDDESPDEPAEVVLRRAWDEWRALAADPRPFQLAWLIGALRLLGVAVEWDGDRPAVRLRGRTRGEVEGVLELLKLHRPAVVEQLSSGRPFDSANWQRLLLTPWAGDWPVWGWRVGDLPPDAHRASVYPVLLKDVPPFYDVVQCYRPDAWRAIPADAVVAVRAEATVGRWLPPGGVYVGPATEEYPRGRGRVAAEEAKLRKRYGFTVHRVEL